MALGELTKQLAGQALRNVATSQTGPAAALPEGVGAAIVSQVQAMQKALKDDEELIVLFHAGADTVRVMEIFVPSWQLLVLAGLDQERKLARVIAAPETLQLVCKVAKVPPSSKPARLNIVLPKPKAE